MHLPYRRLWTATRYCGGTVRFLHFVLCHAFHQHERHEACPHHEEGTCHCRHLRREVSPLHGKACGTTAHTGCGGGQRAVQEQIASLRGLRTCPVRETMQVMRARACIVCDMGSLCSRAYRSAPRPVLCVMRARLRVCVTWEVLWAACLSFSSSRRSSQRFPASRDKLACGETSASPPVEDSLDIFSRLLGRATRPPRPGKFREGGVINPEPGLKTRVIKPGSEKSGNVRCSK